MAVRKQASGKWICECYPHGREGKRVRKQFATKGEAVAFERFTMEQAENKPWTAEKRDTRKLSDLIDVWYRAHGITMNIVKRCLSTGARWSEAEELTRFQLSPYRVTFTKTKGKRNRTDQRNAV